MIHYDRDVLEGCLQSVMRRASRHEGELCFEACC
jgi:hypothetical protein